MGFIRNQEEKLAAKFCAGNTKSRSLPLPAEGSDDADGPIVDEAHRIAREGGNLFEIMKELVSDFFKKK
jgi:hypothetical protein